VDLKFSPEDEQFRSEVRAFLDEKLTPDMRQAAKKTTTVFADKELAMRWQKILVEKGWAVPAWPEAHGGTGWSPTQKYIFGEECAKAGVSYAGIPAAKVKQRATGKGNAGKPAMIAAAEETWLVEVEDDNHADALWVLQVGLEELGEAESSASDQANGAE